MAINFDSDANKVSITVPAPTTVTVTDKGIKGDKGDTGDTGDTGPEGPVGPQGIQGVVGSNGQDGADGASPTASNVAATGAVMKTATSTADFDFVIDEDNFSSNSATKVPTQQSVKALFDSEASARVSGDAINTSATSAVSGQIGLLRDKLGASADGNDLSDIGTPASNDKVLIQDTSDSNNLKYVDFSEFGTGNGTGDITSVVAGTGLTGGDTSGDVTLNVIGGTGITANADDIAITAGGVGTTQLADDSVTEDKLDNTLLAEIDANTAKATNVSTNLAITGTTGARTITSSDGTNAIIPVATDSVSGVMSSADHTKLSGIETGATADQTKTDINGLAITTVGTIDSGIWNGTAIASAYLDADTAHLSGTQTFSGAKTFSDSIQVDNINLDANTVSTTNTNENLLLAANGTGFVELRGNQASSADNPGAIRFNCAANTHGVTIKSPPHSAGATYTLTLPTDDGTDGQILKTDGNGVLDWVNNSGSYTHPNHTGEVTSTSDGAQVIADNVVDEANLKVSNSPTNGYVLTAQSGNTGGLTWAAASGGGSGGIGTADQTLDADRTIDTNGYNLDIELDPTGTADTFTVHDGTHDLFQVDTSTSGTLFSVNDVSGLPKLEVDETEGVIAKSIKVDDSALTAAGQYGKGAEIWYQGTSTPTAGDVYYLDSSGNWAATDADAVATSKGMLAVAAGADSDVNGMVIKGFVYLATDSGGSVGDPVYLHTTTGKLTNDVSGYSAGDIVRIAGYKVATNVVYFDPSKDWIELS